MDSTKDIMIGQIVESRAGRDKGRIFLVLDIIDDQHLFIIDGDLRKIDNPKKKKIKHLIVYNKVLKELSYRLDNNIKVNNAYVRRLLDPFK